MSSVKAFFKKYPIVYAAFGLALIVVLLRFVPSIPGCQAAAGIREVMLAVIVLAVWGLIHGRKGLRPEFTGTKYGLRVMRYLIILYLVFILISVLLWIRKKPDISGGTVLNLALAALAVGIVEEFTCRGMLFGGLVHAFGGTKKAVFWAAAISGFFFGIIHVLGELLIVSEYSAVRLLQMLGKTLQAGTIGFGFALIYMKTRNIWAVAALHSLNDALIFIYSADSPLTGHYVWTEGGGLILGGYAVFVLLTVPFVIRTIREWNREPAPYVCPLDDDFTPCAPVYVPRKKSKQDNAQ